MTNFAVTPAIHAALLCFYFPLVRFAKPHLLAYFGGERKARDLTADAITACAAHRLDEKVRPSTENYELAILRRGFRLAARAGKVASRLEIQMFHVDNARKGFFEPDQYRAVVRLPDHLKPLASVAYITSWRAKSELITRQWRQVDLNGGWLRLEPGESKNGEGREFPFTAELRDLLEAHAPTSGRSNAKRTR